MFGKEVQVKKKIFYSASSLIVNESLYLNENITVFRLMILAIFMSFYSKTLN